MANKSLTQDYLKELFEYFNGDIYWKLSRSNVIKVGKKAGYLNPNMYLSTSIDGKLYLNHRLIFLMHHGYLPKYIDHIDGNPSNNKIENLREVTNSQNCQNSKKRINNLSGTKGVHWHKKNKKWRVQIKVNGKIKSCGLYVDLELAELVASEARNKYHGEYARHK